MKKIYLHIYKIDEKNVVSYKEAYEIFSRISSCSISLENSNILFKDASAHKFEIQEADYIVCIGGDGSLLHIANTYFDLNIPIIGINNGHLGHLCAFKFADIASITIEDIEKLRRSERYLLKFNYKNKVHYAANDVCVVKENTAQSIEANAYVDNKFLNKYRSDGVIISTPTGSTAYNLSVGGPILQEEDDLFIMTPICPHLNARNSYVFKKGKEIKINVSHGFKALITADGLIIGTYERDIKVSLSNKKFTILLKDE